MSRPAPIGEERRGLINILRNVGWLIAGKGAGGVLSLIYLGIVTRSLGPLGFGQFALVFGAAQTLAVLVGFQTWQIVVRFGMPHHQAGRPQDLRDLIGFVLLLDLAGALIGCLLAVAGIGAFAGWFGLDETLRGQALLYTIVCLLAFKSTPMGVLRLYDRFRLSAAVEGVTPVMRTIGAVAVLITGPSVGKFLIAWAAAEVATTIALWIAAASLDRNRIMPRRWPDIPSVLRANPGLTGFALASNLSFTLEGVAKQASTVIVGLFAGPVAAGLYRLAFQTGQGLAKLSDLLSRVVFSEFARVHTAGNRAHTRELLKTATRFAALAGAIVIMLLLLLGKPALNLIAGPEFIAAYPLLLLLGAAAAFDMAGVNFQPALLAIKGAAAVLKLRLILTALLILAFALLLPRYGALGAAIATLLMSFVGLILFGWQARRAVRPLPEP